MRPSGSPRTPPAACLSRSGPETGPKASGIAACLNAGAVNINDVAVNMLAMSLPHGSWKGSGAGVRFGAPCAVEKLPPPSSDGQTCPDDFRAGIPTASRRSALVRRMLRAVIARPLRRGVDRRD